MTAMRKALKGAGLKSIEDLLAAQIDAALVRFPRDFSAAVECLFGNLAYDPILIEHVFAEHAEAILGPLIRKRMEEKSSARGHWTRAAHSDAAARNHPASAGSRLGRELPDTRCPDAQSAAHPSKDGGGGQFASDPRTANAPAINPPRVPISLVASVKREILLDEMMPNGKRFRDCTKSELEGLGTSLGRRAHRCIAVAAQLTAPGQTVNDAGITEDELRRVDAAWNGE